MRTHLATTCTRVLASLVVLASAHAATPARAAAQAPAPAIDSHRIQVTRAELAELLAQYEEAERTGSFSAGFRDRAGSQSRIIRQRLEDGDFRVGDQVVLAVEGETALTGTFPVLAGSAISLPEIGSVPLRGVLRSELESHLTTHLARYIREPRVRAQSLFRIMVSGAVGRPGYYVVPAESLVSDAIMAAGGFGASADLERVSVTRGDAVLWEGNALREAISAGSTFDQLNLTAGDHIVVPVQRTSGAMGSARAALVTLPTLIVSIAALVRLF